MVTAILLRTPFRYELTGELESYQQPRCREPVNSYLFTTCVTAVVRKYTGITPDITYQRKASDTHHDYFVSIKNGNDQISINDGDKNLIEDDIMMLYRERAVCCGDIGYILSLSGISSDKENWVRDVWPVIVEDYTKYVDNILEHTTIPRIVGDYIIFKISDFMYRYSSDICDYIKTLIERVYEIGTFYNPTLEQIERWDMTMKYPLIYQCEWMNVYPEITILPPLYEYITSGETGKIVVVHLYDRKMPYDEDDSDKIIQDPDTPSQTVCKGFQQQESRLLDSHADSGYYIHDHDISPPSEQPLLEWQRKYIIENTTLPDEHLQEILDQDILNDAWKSKFINYATDSQLVVKAVVEMPANKQALQNIIKN